MIEGSARGNPAPGVESLSVKELTAWAPDIIKVLRQMGVSVDGNENSSLDFLCEDAGIDTSDVINALSISEVGPAQRPVEVSSLKIEAGNDKNGKPETLKDLTVKAGEIVALVGPTGSGKSQMLSDVESLVRGDSPSGRKIYLDGELAPEDLRWSPSTRPVAQISQSMNFLLDLSVGDFIDMHILSRTSEESREKIERVVDAACTLCGEPFDPDNQIVSLSGGQSRALMIADVAIISNAPIILIDEIENAGIDRDRAIKFLVGQRKISLIATHDPLIALRADKRLVLKNGAMVKVIERAEKEAEVLNWFEERHRETMVLRESLRAGKLLSIQ